MSGSVIIVVDLDAAVAPPASDSVRQLLAVIEGLSTEDGQLDWRLVSMSLNSPLRAELKAFTPAGEEVPESHLVSAAEAGLRVLDATNDNDPGPAVRRLGDDERRRLRALLAPMRERTGRVQVSVPGRFERTITAQRAKLALAAIARAPQRRAAELGSVEGQILAATTYHGSPALRVRTFLTGDEVTCVFGKESARDIGEAHTLGEVWTGRRVLVSGKIGFDAANRVNVLQASSLRLLGEKQDFARLIEEAQARGDTAIAGRWGEVDA